MFVVTVDDLSPDLSMVAAGATPSRVSHQVLEDPDRLLGALHLHEFDALFPTFPADLDGYVAGCLRAAAFAGVFAGWFAFEGSFHFEHLLTEDIADQVYGLVDDAGVATALADAAITDPRWRRAGPAVDGAACRSAPSPSRLRSAPGHPSFRSCSRHAGH